MATYIVDIPTVTVRKVEGDRVLAHNAFGGATYWNLDLASVQAIEDVFGEVVELLNKLGRANVAEKAKEQGGRR